MLKRITKINSGIFQNSPYAKEGCPDFLKYNLIYGFNGSGKTTLSRVLRHLEMGTSSKLLDTSFVIVGEKDEEKLTQESHLENLRVFNSDFVDENVASLCSGEGDALPILILGAENKDKVAELEKINDDIKIKTVQYKNKESETTINEKSFKSLKTAAARKIEIEAGLGRQYNATNLESDFKNYIKNDGDELVAQYLDIAQETAQGKNTYTRLAEVMLDVDSITTDVENAKGLLAETSINIALSDINKHPDMLGWIDKGYHYHQNNNVKDCLFCQNKIPEDRNTVLGNLFDESYKKKIENLDQSINSLSEVKRELEKIKDKIPAYGDIDKNVTSSGFHIVRTVKNNIDSVTSTINTFISALEKKKNNLNFEVLSLPEFTGRAKEVSDNLAILNEMIQEHNKNIINEKDKKEEAQERVRKHYLQVYFDEFIENKSFFETSKGELDALKTEVEELRKKETTIIESLSSAGVGATDINTLLARYLGHNEISVQVEKNEEGVEGYRLCRNGQPAINPPSEGEKSAIAIIYFLIKLKEQGVNKEDIIVVIDDPVSSMDGNSLTYAANLIWTETKKCSQVFYLTHNLHFMNHFKKRLKRENNKEKEKEKENRKAEFFVLEAYSKNQEPLRNAKIREMPKLILDHDSEYNYCYSLVKKCIDAETAMDCPNLYLMPNLMRKVLETFLQFKLPNQSNLSEQINHNDVKLAFDNDGTKAASLANLVNRASHADSQDAAINLPNFEEYHSTAKIVMELVKKMDEGHQKKMNKLCVK